jgi:8-oxo-dGTP pyrophosphatase MutT (NUDIX family)
LKNVQERMHAAAHEDGVVEGPSVRPRDAATLVLVDRNGPAPRVLLGLRHSRHVFIPGKFVFPGGRVDPTDGKMAALGDLDSTSMQRLNVRLRRPSAARARALALAAIRETGEETGLLLGRASGDKARPPASEWQRFVDAGVLPDLSALTFVFRAITPPKRPRRFDTRFFLAFRDAVGAELPDAVGPEQEFVDLKWMTFAEAEAADLPTITKIVLSEAARRMDVAAAAQPPVPFFYFRSGQFHRDEIA